MKRELTRVEIPGEHDARVRTWETVRAAFETRERVAWPQRHARPLALGIVGAAIVAAAFTPPGHSVVDSIRDAVGRTKVQGVRNAHRELVRLPAPGRLLVQSRRGPWIVQPDGSRRLLGHYAMASWSPHGLFLAAVRYRYELVALDPKANIRWVRGRKQLVRFPRWSFEGYRIAYLSNDTLRVINGDGTGDRGLGAADPRVAPAWRPATHEVAYVARARVRVVDVDTRRTLWTAAAGPDGIRALAWSDDGRRLLVLGRESVAVNAADGRLLGRAPTTGPSTAAAFAPGSHRFALVVGPMVLLVNGDTLRFPSRPLFSGALGLRSVAWSPDGAWVLVGWPGADQLVFVRVHAPKLYAVSNVARQFGPPFPTIAGWCCTS